MTMYLIGDIGNTLTKICLTSDKFKIIKSYNIETNKLTSKKYLSKFFKIILKKKIKKKVLFSSVVPHIFRNISGFLKRKGFSCYEIKSLPLKKIIKIKVDSFKQLGSDRIANAIGSYILFKTNCLIVDFGTATTFDIIKKPGVYRGGVIAPGIKLSIMNLNKYTSALPLFKLKIKNKSYGSNTKDALNAGFLWGYQGLINNIINKITKSFRCNFKIILTGGYSEMLSRFITKKPYIDQNITIKGIMHIYKILIK